MLPSTASSRGLVPRQTNRYMLDENLRPNANYNAPQGLRPRTSTPFLKSTLCKTVTLLTVLGVFTILYATGMTFLAIYSRNIHCVPSEENNNCTSPTPSTTPSNSQTPTPSISLSPTPSNTPSPTPSSTGTGTPTATNSPTKTPTATNTGTSTPTPTSTESASQTASSTETPTSTPTNTPSSTASETSTQTPSNTPSPTSSLTPGSSPSETSTQTPSNTATGTNTPTQTSTGTPTQTPTQTSTQSETPTSTPSNTPSNTPSATSSPSPSNTGTSTPSNSPTQTPTNTPSSTSTPTSTPSPTPSPSFVGFQCADGDLCPNFGYPVDGVLVGPGVTPTYPGFRISICLCDFVVNHSVDFYVSDNCQLSLPTTEYVGTGDSISTCVIQNYLANNCDPATSNGVPCYDNSFCANPSIVQPSRACTLSAYVPDQGATYFQNVIREWTLTSASFPTGVDC